MQAARTALRAQAPWRGLQALLMAALFWLQAAAAQAAPLGDAGARQLLTRAGFAPSAAEIAALAGLSQAEAVDRLLAGVQLRAATPAPDWIDERIVLPRELQAMGEAEQRAYRQKLVRQSLELRGWWLHEMVSTPSPLTERMTLFWHNHFVSAQPKVRWPQLLYRQNELLRTHAVGSFADLLRGIARDPAMLVYLDAATSRRGQPNENFARELMELFTLGQGHYTEADIKEAARAFTGFSIDPASGQFLYRPLAHDGGTKTVLGASGRFGGDDVIDLLLAQPATAEFIVGKLWREFVSPQPDPQRVSPIAAAFRGSGYRIDVALRALLLQPEVVSPAPADLLVKSPVELAVGLLRQSATALDRPGAVALATAAMGQNLFGAPNVRGWPGGDAWINTQTLLARKQFIERATSAGPGAPPMPASMAPAVSPPGSPSEPAVTDLASPDNEGRRRLQAALMQAVRIDTARWLAAADGWGPERPLVGTDIERLQQRVLAAPAVSSPPSGSLALDVLRATLLDPAYQLK